MTEKKDKYEAQKKWNREHRKQCYASARKYKEKNKEKIKAKTREWREKNIEHVNQYEIDYERKNKEHISERKKKYYYKNHERLKKQMCKYMNYYLKIHKKQKKGQVIMTNVNWMEMVKEIDEQIEKLFELKRSIIAVNGLPNYAEAEIRMPAPEDVEPEVDRYGFKKHERRVYYELPDSRPYHNYKKMKHFPLEDAPDYELYENGELFSRKDGRFIEGKIMNNCGDVVWKVLNKDGYLIDIWKRFEMKKFNQEPELN